MNNRNNLKANLFKLWKMNNGDVTVFIYFVGLTIFCFCFKLKRKEKGICWIILGECNYWLLVTYDLSLVWTAYPPWGALIVMQQRRRNITPLQEVSRKLVNPYFMTKFVKRFKKPVIGSITHQTWNLINST